MNELLGDKLRILASDLVALKAVEAIILERIEQERPTIERTDDDKMLGEKFRAYEQAKKILTEVLLDIEAYKDVKDDKIEFNEGK